MRVLQLIDTLNPGGAERVAVTYANALVDHTQASFLCTTRGEGALKEQLDGQVGYLYLAKKNALDPLALWRLIRYCKKHKISVIHAHASSFFTATLACVLMTEVELIWHDHYGKSETLETRSKKVLKWCSKYFKAILSVNQNLAVWARNNLHCQRVEYFKNAISELDPQQIKAAKLPGIPGSRILLMANLRPQKDHINAIAAVKKVRRVYPQVSLHFIGMHWDDSYYQQLRLFMDETEEKEFIHYHGSKQNVAAYMKACDIGLLSSNSEGLPMAILEYANMGLPVVCTRVGQCAEVIQTDGFLAPAEDSTALATAILTALDNPLETAKKAKALRNRVLADYSMQAIIPKLLELYG